MAKKSVTEYGDKVGEEDKTKIEAAVKDAEELKKNDATKEELEAKAEELAKTSQKLGEVMYAQAQGGGRVPRAQGGGAGAGAAGGAGGQHGDENGRGFTEVKDQK
jgi:molecular chaperone DnaK